MFVKIITCTCKIDELKKNVSIHVNTVFGCCSEKKKKYFATRCEDCPLNAYLFLRNYFSAINCICKNVNKKTYCNYRRRLQDHLNYTILFYKQLRILSRTRVA